jgi:hypothetical protein
VSDEWYTPKHIFDSLGLLFDLDVATPCDETIHTPTLARYCKCDDGLAQTWNGLVWMNPPYSKPTPWIDKWLAHGNGLCLVPNAKAKWYKRLWDSDAHLLALEPNIKFDRPNDKPGQIFMGLTLAAMGDVSYRALLQSNLGRVR